MSIAHHESLRYRHFCELHLNHPARLLATFFLGTTRSVLLPRLLGDSGLSVEMTPRLYISACCTYEELQTQFSDCDARLLAPARVVQLLCATDANVSPSVPDFPWLSLVKVDFPV